VLGWNLCFLNGHPWLYLQRTYACTAYITTKGLHSYIPPYALAYIFTLQTYPYKPTQTYTLPTYQPYKSPYTLHTCRTLNTYKPLLACPAPTYTQTPTNTTPYTACLPCPSRKLNEQKGRIVAAPMAYYVLRHLLAKLLHLNLIDLLRASWRRKGYWISTKIYNSGRKYNHYHWAFSSI